MQNKYNKNLMVKCDEYSNAATADDNALHRLEQTHGVAFTDAKHVCTAISESWGAVPANAELFFGMLKVRRERTEQAPRLPAMRICVRRFEALGAHWSCFDLYFVALSNNTPEYSFDLYFVALSNNTPEYSFDLYFVALSNNTPE